MNEREEIPDKRHGVRMPVKFKDAMGNETKYPVQFNIAESGRVIECFVSQDEARINKTGSQFRAMLEDGCKAISRLLQYGDTMAQLAAYFGEDRPEGAAFGSPSSHFGAIARAGAELDAIAETCKSESTPL